MKVFKVGKRYLIDDEAKTVWRRIRIRPVKRSACPSDEQMAAYLDRRLSSRDRNAVELHLLQCEQCLETVLILRRAAASPDPAIAPQTLKRIHDLGPQGPSQRFFTADFVRHFIPLRPVPVLAAIMLVVLSLGSFDLGARLARDVGFVRSTFTAELQFNLVGADLPTLNGGQQQ